MFAVLCYTNPPVFSLVIAGSSSSLVPRLLTNRSAVTHCLTIHLPCLLIEV